MGLISLLSANAFSQNKNHYKPGNSWSKIENDSSLMKRFNYELVVPPKSFDYTEQHLNLSPEDFPGMPKRRIPNDNMPCLNPQGYYSAVIIEPDSTKNYYLKIQER